MRYVLQLEAIGDNYSYYLHRFLRSNRPFDKRALDAFRLGNRSLSPWVASIKLDGRDVLTRQFIEGHKDYSEANGIGSRGIVFYYFLKPGIYEINERMTWTRARRYFLRITDSDTATEITKDEAIACLSTI